MDVLFEILKTVGWFAICFCAGWGFADILQCIFTKYTP